MLTCSTPWNPLYFQALLHFIRGIKVDFCYPQTTTLLDYYQNIRERI